MSNTATVEQAKELGLLEEEYNQICDILERKPNFTELSIYSVMWSEHCSYKNSIKWLKTLPKDGPHMLVKGWRRECRFSRYWRWFSMCF